MAFSNHLRTWLRSWNRKRAKRSATSLRQARFESLETRHMLASWTPLAHFAPSGIGTMELLSDGTVMAQGGGVSKNWYKLTPDSTGSYANGNWSTLTPMGLERLYMASHVLKDGRVWVLGGEYSGPSGTSNWINSGEIYDPVNNFWTSIPNIPQSQFGDVPTALLPDGRVLAGSLTTASTFIYDPSVNTWSTGQTKLGGDRSDEETWIKLPDDSILSYNIFGNKQHAQRFDPVLNTWVDSGAVPVKLETTASEIGPGFLLYDGRVLQVGGTNQTAIYTPPSTRTDTGTWVAGPVIPSGYGGNDTPGAMMPNGHVIFAAGPTPGFASPTILQDFDPVTDTLSTVSTTGGPNLTGTLPYTTRMLVLPSGQVLYTTGSSQLYLFNPDGAPNPAWAPTISSIANNGDGTYTLTGTQLNGLGEGASYGDDAEMSSNYPIVRLRSQSNVIYYARTYNWSSTGVATGSTPVTTQVKLPTGLPVGRYFVSAVANGIASQEFTLDLANQAPTLDSIADVSLLEDAGQQAINLSGISAGPSTDNGQTITVTATSSNPALIPNPTITYTSPAASGTLRFTPAANAYGTATITVTVHDDGGVASGGVDTIVRTFQVSITDVNDAPTTTADTLSPVAEDSAAFNFAASVLTANDSAGPADESGQTLTVTGVSNAVGGTVSLNAGNIVFTPAANFFGTASFTYTVQDNGTSNGVADPQSTNGSVSFIVTEVNDAPVVTNDVIQPIAKNAAFRNIPFSLLTTNDSRGPNEDAQALTITSVSNPIGGTVAINGTNVVFSPTPGFVGIASFNYTVVDNGTTNGAADPLSASGSAQFTILDVLTSVNFATASSSIAENGGAASIVAVLDTVPSTTVVIPFHVTGTATGADYNIGVSSITFPAGQATVSLPVTIVNDLLDENDESIVITLDVSSDAQLGATSVHTLTVIDDDPLPVANFVTATTKRDESGGATNLIVSLSTISGRDVTIPLNFGGTTNGSDYSVAQASVVIPAGQLTAAIPVTVIDDSTVEPLETLTISLGASTTATLGAVSAHTITIVDNDIVPVVQFTQLAQSVNEAAGTTIVRVTMTQELFTNVVLPLTVSGTASANDYSLSTNTLTIPAGQTSAAFTVTIVNDTRDELNDTLTFTLGLPANAQLGAIGTHTITIVDNDPAPLVQFSTLSQLVSEGAGNAKITVRLSQVSDLDVIVPFNLGGTADDSDASITTPVPVLSAAPITISAGQLTGSINVAIVDDTTPEPTETIAFAIGTPTNGTRGAVNTDTLSIVDNDALVSVQFATGDMNVGEASGSLPVFVTLSSIAQFDVTVPLVLSGSATSDDYAVSTTTVTIPAGQTRAIFTVAITDDQIDEPAETLSISIGSPTGANTGVNSTLNITIDDNDPILSFARNADVTTSENGTFTIVARTLSPVISDLAVPFSVFGAAVAGLDYTLSANQFQFLSGSSTAAVTVTVIDDATVESTESVTLQLQPPANTSLGSPGFYTLFISDNDSPLTPGLDLNGAASGQDLLNPVAEYVEDTAAVLLVPNATVSPPGVQTLTSINVFLESAPNGSAESLTATNVGGATATTYNPTTRSLLISGGTLSDMQSVLRSVAYQNTSQNPSSGGRFVSFTANFSGSTDVHRRKLTVTPVDDAPVIATSGGATSYITGTAAKAIDPSIGLTDVDSSQIVRAVVTLTDAEAGDTLSFTPTNGVTAVVAGNVVTLTGNGNVTLFRIALSKVNFATSNVGDGSRTVSFVVTDSSGIAGVTGATSGTVTKSITVQAPLLFAGETAEIPRPSVYLTNDQLQPLVAEAIARWESAGATASQLAVLQAATVEIRAIDDPQVLGLGGGNSIVLDDNAGGHGWFVDSTPTTNDEFTTPVTANELHATSGDAATRVDLLTVVMHEFGHLLGLDDMAIGSAEHSLMADSIGIGTRRTPSTAALSTYFARLGDSNSI